MRILLASVSLALLASLGAATAQTAAPPIATTKVEGTDNVYIFRNAIISRCSSSPRTA